MPLPPNTIPSTSPLISGSRYTPRFYTDFGPGGDTVLTGVKHNYDNIFDLFDHVNEIFYTFGDSPGFALEAGHSMNEARAVATIAGKAAYADNTKPGYYAVGIALNNAVVGHETIIQTGGKLVLAGMGWTTDKPVFFEYSGRLTQTPPTSGFSQKIGTASGSDVLIINITQPVILA